MENSPLELTKTEKKEVVKEIYNLSKGNLTYYILIALSAIIATLGLVLNNIPIVIGSMLIAPFMAPILATSLGMIRGDTDKFKMHIKYATFGILFAIFISTLVNVILPFNEITPEILSRTSPTLLDLIVALCAGGVAALAVSKENVPNTLGGVTIAVAILPPLSVLGFGLATLNGEVIAGSSLLFISNLIAIIFISSIVFFFYRLQAKQETDNFYQHKGIEFAALLLVAIAIPLTMFLLNTIDQKQLEETTRNVFTQKIIEISPEIDIVKFTPKLYLSEPQIDTFLRVPQDIHISSEQKEMIKESLQKVLGYETKLDISLTQYIPDGQQDRIKTIEDKLEKLQETNTKLLEYLSQTAQEIKTSLFGVWE